MRPLHHLFIPLLGGIPLATCVYAPPQSSIPNPDLTKGRPYFGVYVVIEPSLSKASILVHDPYFEEAAFDARPGGDGVLQPHVLYRKDVNAILRGESTLSRTDILASRMFVIQSQILPAQIAHMNLNGLGQDGRCFYYAKYVLKYLAMQDKRPRDEAQDEYNQLLAAARQRGIPSEPCQEWKSEPGQPAVRYWTLLLVMTVAPPKARFFIEGFGTKEIGRFEAVENAAQLMTVQASFAKRGGSQEASRLFDFLHLTNENTIVVKLTTYSEAALFPALAFNALPLVERDGHCFEYVRRTMALLQGRETRAHGPGWMKASYDAALAKAHQKGLPYDRCREFDAVVKRPAEGNDATTSQAPPSSKPVPAAER